MEQKDPLAFSNFYEHSSPPFKTGYRKARELVFGSGEWEMWSREQGEGSGESLKGEISKRWNL